MSADRKGGSANPSLRSLTAKAAALSVAWGHRHRNVLTVPRVATRHPHHRADERPTTKHRPPQRGGPSSTGHASFTRSNRGETEGESASCGPASTSQNQVCSGHLLKAGTSVAKLAPLGEGSPHVVRDALGPSAVARGVFCVAPGRAAGSFSRRCLPAAGAAGALRPRRLAVSRGGEPHRTPVLSRCRHDPPRRRSSSRRASLAPSDRTSRTLPCSHSSTRSVAALGKGARMTPRGRGSPSMLPATTDRPSSWTALDCLALRFFEPRRRETRAVQGRP